MTQSFPIMAQIDCQEFVQGHLVNKTVFIIRGYLTPPTLLTVRHLILVGFRVIFHLFVCEHSESRLGCISAAHCLSVRPMPYSRVLSEKVCSPASMWFFMSSAKSRYSCGPRPPSGLESSKKRCILILEGLSMSDRFEVRSVDPQVRNPCDKPWVKTHPRSTASYPGPTYLPFSVACGQVSPTLITRQHTRCIQILKRPPMGPV